MRSGSLAVALALAILAGAAPSTARGMVEDPAPEEAQARALEPEIVRALERGDPRRAAELASRQLALRDRADAQPNLGLASTLSYLALAHRNLDEFAIALTHARRALAITLAVRGPESLDTATALTNLAGILRERGDAVAAERALQRALQIRKVSLDADHPALAQSYNNLASLRLQQGDPASAEELYREALRIVEARLGAAHDNAAKARQNLARALAERGKTDDALLELARVERTLRAAEPVVASRLADVIAQRAAIEAERGRLDEAVHAYGEAIGLRTTMSAEPQVEVVAARIALARLHARTGDAGTARRLHDASVSDAVSLVGEAHPLTLEARSAAADLALSLGEHERAIELLEPATTAYVEARRLAAEGLRSATADLSSPFDRLALAYGRTRDFVRAWEAAERGRAQLLDALLEADDARRGGVLPRLMRELLPNTAAVGWLQIEDRRIAWIVRGGQILHWIEFAATSEATVSLREQLGSAPDLFTTADPAALETLARTAHQEWFGPIASHLAGIERLVLVPAGPLLGVPVGALVDDAGNLLEDRFTLELAPSMRTWLEAGTQRTPRAKGRTVLALGDPPFRPDHLETLGAPSAPRRRGAVDLRRLPRLVGTRAEATAARQHFARGELLLGTAASEARLRAWAREDRLRSFDVLHLATHALVDRERPGLSTLALSQIDLPEPTRSLADEGPLDDGALTVDEILREWKLDAELVTLSACDTGLGRETEGDGLLGFAQAFLLVGARSLVISLWEVDDDATVLLMDHFYAALESEPGRVRPAEALRHARRLVRTHTDARGEMPYAHPYYWAPFVVVGTR